LPTDFCRFISVGIFGFCHGFRADLPTDFFVGISVGNLLGIFL
jgi:hypothetical protein